MGMVANLDQLLDTVAAPAPPVLRMDYDQIADVRDREILRAAATKIRSTLDNARWVVGRELIVAKRDVGHGSWILWLNLEFQMAEKTAQNYMNAARLIETHGADYADLGGTVQAVLGGHDPAVVAQAGPALLELQAQGAGSGRNGAVNVEDAKAAINRAAGRTVYTQAAPPAKSTAPDRDRPALAPVATKNGVYTGDPVQVGVDVPAAADLVVVRLSVALARELRHAAQGGALDGFLSAAQVAELVGALGGDA